MESKLTHFVMSWFPLLTDSREPTSVIAAYAATYNKPPASQQTSATAVAFDQSNELLCTGWSSGFVSVYRAERNDEFDGDEASPPYALSRWSRFPGHNSWVKQIHSDANIGVYSISANSMALHAHGGATLFRHDLPHAFGDAGPHETLTSMVPSGDTHVYCSTSSGNVFLLNLMTSSTGPIARWTLPMNVSPGDSRPVAPAQHAAHVQLHKRLTKRVVTNLRPAGEPPSHTGDAIRTMKLTERGILLCATSRGGIHGVDPRAPAAQSGLEIKATSGGKISDMDVMTDTVASCGWSLRERREPFIKIFDLRMRGRQLMPLQCATPPSRLRFLPLTSAARSTFRYSAPSELVSCSPNGVLRFSSDVHSPEMCAQDFYSQIAIPAPNHHIEAMEVSTTGDLVSAVDSLGQIHLWGRASREASPDEGFVCGHWIEPEFLATQPVIPEQPLEPSLEPSAYFHYTNWDNPESSEGAMSLGLESAQPETIPLSEMFSDALLDAPLVRPRQLKIQPAIADQAAQSLARLLARSAHQLDPSANLQCGIATNTLGAPGLSLLFGRKGRGLAYVDPDPRVMNATTHHDEDEEDVDETYDALRIRYREFVLSKFGHAETDFTAYNSTQFSGLEPPDSNTPEAWCGVLVQLVHLLPPLAELYAGYFNMKPVPCIVSDCGLAQRNLLHARRLRSDSKVCDVRSFCRSLRANADFMALGLNDTKGSATSLDRKSSVFLRFLLLALATTLPERPSKLERIAGVRYSHLDSYEVAESKVYETSKESWTPLIELVQAGSFADMLNGALDSEKRHRSAWCDQVKAQTPLLQRKTAVGLSDFLVCAAHSVLPHDKAWDKGFVPVELRIALAQDAATKRHRVAVRRPGPVEAAAASQEAEEGDEVFELVAVVSHVVPRTKSTTSPKGHLVLHAKLLSEHAQLPEERGCGVPTPVGAWLLFNDFAVSLSNEEEAVDFTASERRPALFVYKKKAVALPLPTLAPEPISREIFTIPTLATNAAAAAQTNVRAARAIQAMRAALADEPGTPNVLAVDCEFVALSVDASEFLPDGSRVITAPSQLFVARASVLSGRDGALLIDDYVLPAEPVADYLTRFSGLVPSDLDPFASPHALIPFRHLVAKFVHYLEAGCIFLGHGLDKDFRVMNLVVPPEQVIDTVHLYSLPGQRKLSLRFLSAIFLEQEIQDKVHDSIQDARAALLLYRKYEELTKAGTFDEALRRAYAEGPGRNWT